MSDTDEIAGVFDVIDTTSAAHNPVEHTEVSDTAKAEGSDSTAETEETKTESKDEKQKTEPEAKETGTTDEGETQQTQTDDKTVEPSKTETSETKTETENTQDFSKWQETLPPPPAEYAGKKPEFNDDGQITNMTPQEYLDYTIGMAQQASRTENYSTFVEGKALDIAEQILPDIKTNQNVRKMVENTRIASLLSGNQMDTVQAALQVRELLGISSEKLQAAKTEGANSTKASIEIQKNAALETGSTQKKTTPQGEKISQLQKRVQKGDDIAFAELLGVWEEKGLLK
jgi:hypothetical protein